MIDKDIIKIANERIRIEIGEQNNNLSKEIERVKAKMPFAFMSSEMISCISDLCIVAVKNRAQLIWQVLFRFITTTGISYSEELSEELKSLVASNLPKELIDLRGYINDTAGEELDIARNQAIKKVGTEIDLFIQSLRKKLLNKKMNRHQRFSISIHLLGQYKQATVP